eukprot:9474611-Pyramimonas_sp.AAC.1
MMRSWASQTAAGLLRSPRASRGGFLCLRERFRGLLRRGLPNFPQLMQSASGVPLPRRDED